MRGRVRFAAWGAGTASRQRHGRASEDTPIAYHERVSVVSVDLPGHELVSEGLADLAAGRETEAGLLVAMAAPRLRALGLEVPSVEGEMPSHRLYELLCEADENPHSRYNALVARMVSFARAAERASTR
jgi:hypothetical protein